MNDGILDASRRGAEAAVELHAGAALDTRPDTYAVMIGPSSTGSGTLYNWNGNAAKLTLK
jgi:hypothetical protein